MGRDSGLPPTALGVRLEVEPPRAPKPAASGGTRARTGAAAPGLLTLRALSSAGYFKPLNLKTICHTVTENQGNTQLILALWRFKEKVRAGAIDWES